MSPLRDRRPSTIAPPPCPASQAHSIRSAIPRPLLVALLDGQEKLELGWQLLLGVEAVGEVDAADAAVSVDLHAQRLDVVRAVRTAREVRQVELDLIPSLVETYVFYNSELERSE